MGNLILASQVYDHAKAAQVRKLRAKVVQGRSQYYKLYNSVLRIASLYLDELPEADTIVRLRREIRLATKGTPLTIEQDAVTSAGYVSHGSEQLFNGQSHLVKSAYRVLAPLVHPDRGGDPELFQLVNAAYHLRDLTFLQETYLTLTKDTLWWASDEALNYMHQEAARPLVSRNMLQNHPLFRIVRQHVLKRTDLAEQAAKFYASKVVLELTLELQYLNTRHITPSPVENNDGNLNTQEENDGYKDGCLGTGEEGHCN